MQTNLRRSCFDCIFIRTAKAFKLALQPSLLPLSQLKKIFVVRSFQLFALIMLLSSCRKELNDPILDSAASAASDAAKKELMVDAGPVRKVVYPDNTSTKLYGSGGGKGVSFKWKQIRGSSVATIDHPTDKNPNVSHLKPGLYFFTLTATDRNGHSQTDTTAVTVLQRMEWHISGTEREALVHLPTGSGSEKAPVIFAFHGHGGTNLSFAEKGFELEWPRAIVVYPQGLPTKSHDDREGKKYGWQHEVGEVNNHTKVKDQDIKFFDAMLSTFERRYNANPKEIFVHGWSNGGSFIYNVLWPERGNKLAAISSASATLLATKEKNRLPVMHIAGKFDPLVKFIFSLQSLKAVLNLNRCNLNANKWGIEKDGIYATRYWSPLHSPVVFLQYYGGHEYPSDVAPLIVKFFKSVAWKIDD